MNVLLVDDEYIALERLVESVQEAIPKVCVYKTQNAAEALKLVKNYDIEVAFLDIEMMDVNGITLGKQIKCIRPNMNIIFTTGYSQYALDAYGLDASGYLLKPILASNIRHQLNNLRYPIPSKAKNEVRYIIPNGKKRQRVRIQCFKNFEIFIDDQPVKFKYEKSKEMLAYIVDRTGALCSNNELNSVLWGDEIHNSYLRMLKKDIQDTFAALKCDRLLVRQRGKIGINVDQVSCDYYDWQKGLPAAINSYQGEYMSQYSWAEYTNSNLSAMTRL